MARSGEEQAAVQELLRAGLTASEISRRTGVPRTTVRDWRDAKGNGRRQRCPRCTEPESLPPAADYSYLLGLYLGDGCISRGARAYRLRLFLDAAYPGIVASAIGAVEAIRPGKAAWCGRHGRTRGVVVSMYWQHWPCLFPQHGPGMKHSRVIRLEPWQGEIVAEHPELFVRGLIHSDGCRIVASDRGRPSVRYHFANLSEDIKDFFCDALDVIGVEWTRPCGKQVNIYRKASVEMLDRFIGPKD